MNSSASGWEFAVETADPPVRGFLHQPESDGKNGLVITHGAGGNAQGALLTALADALCVAGITVLRCNLPFRQSRPYGPPRPGEAARDRTGLRNAVTAVKEIVNGRVFVGGQSYGGRQASMMCAEGPELVAGLLLLSYPLHPPGKPEQLRKQHFPDLRVPCLFVHGTRDPFGSVEEIESARKMIPSETKLLVVDGAGHDLGFKGKGKREELPAKIVLEFQALLSEHVRG